MLSLYVLQGRREQLCNIRSKSLGVYREQAFYFISIVSLLQPYLAK